MRAIATILIAATLAAPVRAECVTPSKATVDSDCVAWVIRDGRKGTWLAASETDRISRQGLELVEVRRQVTELLAGDTARQAQVALLQRGLTAQQSATDAADAKAAAESKRADLVARERDSALAKADQWCRVPALCAIGGVGLVAIGVVAGFVVSEVRR
jgi:hypothetical protein